MYIHRSLHWTRAAMPGGADDRQIEGCNIRLQLRGNRHIHIIGLYIPCLQTRPNNRQLKELIDDDTILIGDFNAHHPMLGHRTADQRGAILHSATLRGSRVSTHPNPSRPSNTGMGSLDLAIINSDIITSSTTHTLDSVGSDHLPWDLSLQIPIKKTTILTRDYTNFHRHEYQLLTDDLMVQAEQINSDIHCDQRLKHL